jgi:hypothetical protein
MYYRARYYAPAQARFISEDSYGFGGGDANFYAFVGGDPLSANDPSGHHPLLVLLWVVRIAQVGLLINAGYQTGRLLLDQCVSQADKVVALASLAASAVGGFVLGKVAGRILAGLVAATRAAKAAKAGIPLIRGNTAALRNPAQVDRMKDDMLNGNYRFNDLDGIITGVIDKKGVVHLSEGQHRMNAALEIFEETGSPEYVRRLLETARRGVNGRSHLAPGEPDLSFPLPRR